MKSKVLIVDDDAAIVMAIETILNMENYATLTAKNGRESLEIAKKELPSLILLDYMLPDMTGRQVVDKIREVRALVDTPIILISATHGLHQLVKNSPIQGIIEKPFELETLISTVAAFVNHN
ncbi:N/A [soil metagenome]